MILFFMPKIARIPQTVHKTSERPTEPERRSTRPGVMNIPEPNIY